MGRGYDQPDSRDDGYGHSRQDRNVERAEGHSASRIHAGRTGHYGNRDHDRERFSQQGSLGRGSYARGAADSEPSRGSPGAVREYGSGAFEHRRAGAGMGHGMAPDWGDEREFGIYDGQGRARESRAPYSGGYQSRDYGSGFDDDQRGASRPDAYPGRGYDPSRDPGRIGSGRAMERGGIGRRTGGFRGRGPRNYSRSDERIAEDLNERLMDDDEIDASDIGVRVEDGVVTLEGTVRERWAKHRAEDLADSCGGVKDVENRIRVQRVAGSQQRQDGAGADGAA